MDVASFVTAYPRIYHMTAAGSWPLVKARGLLSTTAILDELGIEGARRTVLETKQRRELIHMGTPDGSIVLRDQLPMSPERLQKALIDGTSPSQWYRLLNGLVFFWAEEHRQLRLLNARSYRDLQHDVITVDAKSLAEHYESRIRVCRMNSGSVFPYVQPRGVADFMTIADYPTKRSGAPLKPVVEVVIDYAVPDIARFVLEVRRMKGSETLAPIPL
jgi:hypothetical protein